MNASVITRAMTSDGSARIICADTTAIVQKAFEVHKTANSRTGTRLDSYVAYGLSVEG